MQLLDIKWSAATGEWMLKLAIMVDDLDLTNPFLSRADYVRERRIYYFVTPGRAELTNPGLCRDLWAALAWDESGWACAENVAALRDALNVGKIKPE